MPEGAVNTTIHFLYNSPERSLTQEEVNERQLALDRRAAAALRLERIDAVSIEWLEELETRVREAAERLRELREENQSLQERVDELETKLTAPSRRTSIPASSGERPRPLRADRSSAQARRLEPEEREEIRGRVERLTGSWRGWRG